jgi:AcrR family transcriptional regulator
MKPERLTRAQRKEQTREHLFDAARTMFIKKGLAATSVEDIASTAGYTRGAFYSSFDSKLELLLELLRRDHDNAQAKLRAIVENGGAREQMKARAIAHYNEYIRDCDSFPLWMEATLLACRDTAFQQRFNAFRREKLERVSAYIRALAEPDGNALSLQADALALGLVSLCDGVRLFRTCDSQMASDEMIQMMLAGLFPAWCGGYRQKYRAKTLALTCPAEAAGHGTPTAGIDN